MEQPAEDNVRGPDNRVVPKTFRALKDSTPVPKEKTGETVYKNNKEGNKFQKWFYPILVSTSG